MTTPARPDTDPNPLLEAALAYAARGWRVVPLHSVDVRGCSCSSTECKSPGKHPRTRHGLKDGTTDPEQIRGWWAKWPRANVAIVCGPDSDVWMVGPDGERGRADMAALEGGRERVEASAAAESQGGGVHYLFCWPAGGGPIPNRKNHRGTKIDVRGCGDGPGYFVAAPSVGEKGVYKWLVPPPAGKLLPAPDWLVDWARGTDPKPAEPPPAARPAPAPGPDAAETHRRAVQYLNKLPDAVSGERGHDQTFWAARVLVWGFALPEHEALALLAAYYNPRCKPQWSEKELRHKVREAADRPFNKEKGWLLKSLDPVRDFPPPAVPSAGPASASPAAAGEWGDPIPLAADPAAAPEFPLDVYPPALADFCRDTAAATNTPPDYAATYLLATASGLVGGTMSVGVGPGWVEPCIVWGCVVAPVSAGKSPALNAVLGPLKDAQARRKRAGDEGVLFTDDATPEGLVALLRKQDRWPLYADHELAGLVAGFNQYKAGGQGRDRQTYLKLWDGGTASAVRKNPDAPHVYASNAGLPLVGALQPAVAGELFTRDDGLPERLAFCYPDPLPPARYGRQPLPKADEWAAVVDLLLGLKHVEGEYGPRAFVCRLSPAAERVFDDWTGELALAAADPDRDRKLDGTRSKLRGYAARFALVRRLIRAACTGAVQSPQVVGEEDVAAGVRLARYFLAHAERVRRMLGGNDPTAAERVLRWLARRKPPADSPHGAFTRRDAHRALVRTFPRADDLRPPLKLLVQHGYLRYADQPPTGGRAAEAVYLPHPRLADLVSPSVNIRQRPALTEGDVTGQEFAEETPILSARQRGVGDGETF